MFRTICRFSGALLSLVLVAALASALGVHPAHAAQLHQLHHVAPAAGLVAFGGMLHRLEAPLSYTGLVARRTAGQIAAANGAPAYRVYPDFLYDTISYPQAGPNALTTLKFFQGVNANANDLTLTNTAQGALPSPQIFWGQSLSMTILDEATAVDDTVSANVNITNDFDRIITTSRSFVLWQTSASTIVQGTIPLRGLGTIGGTFPMFGGNNVPAASHGWVYHAPRLSNHGGFPVDIILMPTEQLQINILFGVQKAITAATNIRLELYGWRYIPVGVG